MSPLLSSLSVFPPLGPGYRHRHGKCAAERGRNALAFWLEDRKKNFGSLADTTAIMERGSSGKQPGGFVSEARPILRLCKCGPDPGRRTTHRL